MSPAVAKLTARIGSSIAKRIRSFFLFLIMLMKVSISHLACAIEPIFKNSKTCLGILMICPSFSFYCLFNFLKLSLKPVFFAGSDKSCISYRVFVGPHEQSVQKQSGRPPLDLQNISNVILYLGSLDCLQHP